VTVPVTSLADDVLAGRHLPILRLDAREPYRPTHAGYTVFRAPGQSPSSKFLVEPRDALTIEYAVWYDWDIGHLYDLEHVWVHLDGAGEVIAIEASAHGRRETMVLPGGQLPLRGRRPELFVEPGKHAHWADGAALAEEAGERLRALCGPLAGIEGVHRGNPFAQGGLYRPTPLADRLARLKMVGDGFVPSFSFTASSEDGEGMRPLPWPDLTAIIPARVEALMAELPHTVPHLKAVFLDCGDTLVDEGTEAKRPGSEGVLSAELLPGARDTVLALRAAGYPLVLVADGPRETFENILKHHGLWDAFDAQIISGDIGELKPSPKMFEAALRAVGLEAVDRRDVVMVGNNLARDIRGANASGLTSVFFSWSDRRTRTPADPSEKPDYVIAAITDLPRLLDGIEQTMKFKFPAT
jgi:FMN phosphatase YigB (HAD superfamily)